LRDEVKGAGLLVKSHNEKGKEEEEKDLSGSVVD